MSSDGVRQMIRAIKARELEHEGLALTHQSVLDILAAHSERRNTYAWSAFCMHWLIDDNAAGKLYRVQKAWSDKDADYSISLNSYSSARLWDGAARSQTASGYGH